MAEEKNLVEMTTEEKRRKEQENLFKSLIQLDVNNYTEKKRSGGVELTYLSWSWAWQEFLKKCPDATYEIKQFVDKDGVSRCYQYDETLGYMVFTSITANGLTRDMWLPVMDGANKSMKDHAYTYMTKSNGEKTVEQASMFDVNKTIMRCLVKNLAMFGLGLYIYAGEDLPIEIDEPCTLGQVMKMRELAVNEKNVLIKYKVGKLEDLTYKQAEFVINSKEKALEKANGGN